MFLGIFASLVFLIPDSVILFVYYHNDDCHQEVMAQFIMSIVDLANVVCLLIIYLSVIKSLY